MSARSPFIGGTHHARSTHASRSLLGHHGHRLRGQLAHAGAHRRLPTHGDHRRRRGGQVNRARCRPRGLLPRHRGRRGRAAYAPASPGAPFLPAARPAPEPRERPGLGTEWGESRDSRVHDVPSRGPSPAPVRDGGALLQRPRRRRGARDYHGGLVAAIPSPAAPSRFRFTTPWAILSRLSHRRPRVRRRPSGPALQHRPHEPFSRRFEAVVTVDGLDVINGKPAPSYRGYVLMPLRPRESTASARVATRSRPSASRRVADSYAAQTGGDARRRRHRRGLLRRARRRLDASERRAPHARHGEPFPPTALRPPALALTVTGGTDGRRAVDARPPGAGAALLAHPVAGVAEDLLRVVATPPVLGLVDERAQVHRGALHRGEGPARAGAVAGGGLKIRLRTLQLRARGGAGFERLPARCLRHRRLRGRGSHLLCRALGAGAAGDCAAA